MKDSVEKVNSVLANQRSWFQYIQLSVKHNLVAAASCAPYYTYISGIWVVPTLPIAVSLSIASAFVGTVVYGIIWHKDLFHLGHQLCGYKLPDSEEEHDDFKEGEYHGYWKYWITGVLFHSVTAFLGASAIALTMQNILPWGELAGAIPTSIQDPLYSTAGKVMASDFAHGIVSNSWFANHVAPISWRYVLPFGFNVLYSVFIAPWALNHIITTGRFNSRELKENVSSLHEVAIQKFKAKVADLLKLYVSYLKQVECNSNLKRGSQSLEGELKEEIIELNKKALEELNKLIEDFVQNTKIRLTQQKKEEDNENINIQFITTFDNDRSSKINTASEEIAKKITKLLRKAETQQKGNINTLIQNAINFVCDQKKYKELYQKHNFQNVDSNEILKRVLQDIEKVNVDLDNTNELKKFEKSINSMDLDKALHITIALFTIEAIKELKAQIEQHKAEREQYEKIQLQGTGWSAVKMVISPCIIGMLNVMIQVGCSICF